MNEATTTTIPDIFQVQNIEKLDEIFKDRLERISQFLSTSSRRSYNH